MFIAALFIMVTAQLLSTNEWLNKMCVCFYLHTVEYYSAMKESEVLITWYNTGEV